MAFTEKLIILVVEDSRVLAKVIEQRLSTFFRVEMVHDGEDAINRLRGETEYAAIVLDLVLPKADGFEVLRFLRTHGKETPVIITSVKPRSDYEGEAEELGVKVMLSKPLDFGLLADKLHQVVKKNTEVAVAEPVENKATGRKYPFHFSKKRCFICGYQKVNVFFPIANGMIEDWSRGVLPSYSPQNGFEEWDWLKTMVSVCPYCLFASSDPKDFADNEDAIYPYNEESKRILARSISIRKRLVPEALEIDPRFDHAHRDRETVLVSLILAEKCCNGLILAGKLGAYSQSGFYSTLIGALQNSVEKYQEALVSFKNELKHKDSPRRVLVRTHFFCIVLNMQLNQTALGHDIMKKVESLYADARYEEISDEERDWLIRINHIWKVGMGTGPLRQIT